MYQNYIRSTIGTIVYTYTLYYKEHSAGRLDICCIDLGGDPPRK